MSLILLSACSSGKTGNEEAGIKEVNRQTDKAPSLAGSVPASNDQVQIRPADPVRKSTVKLLLPAALQNPEIEWLVNAAPVPEISGESFYVEGASKGDSIQARVLSDGEVVLSNTVTVKNSPPEFTRIKIMPEVFKPGDILFVDAVAEDADGDDVGISYEWTINGEHAGSEQRIGKTLKRGDKISLTLRAYDGEVYSRDVIMQREIRNFPPMITEHKNFDTRNDEYTYQVKATDPDGDALSYSLQSSPPGMTIDSKTGLVRWKAPADFSGKAAFAVAVTDGNGGEAKQELSFEIYD